MAAALVSSLMAEMNVQDVLKDLALMALRLSIQPSPTLCPELPICLSLAAIWRFIAGVPDNERLFSTTILDKEELKAELSEKFSA